MIKTKTNKQIKIKIKQKRVDLSKMVDKSLERRESLFSKVINSNLNINTLKKYNKSQWNKALGTHIRKNDSLKAQKRLLTQIKSDINTVSNRYIVKKKIKNIEIKKAIKKEAYKSFKITYGDISIGKVQKTLKPLKTGEYITTVIQTNDGKKFISSSSKKDFKRQLDIIDASYGVLSIGDCGQPKVRVPFITKEYRQFALDKGIKL